MILRRFTQHVTEQNWFAVFLDLVVVVLGIFLGLQVSNWNDERRADRELRTYLDSLATEFQASADILENHVAWQTGIMDGLTLALRALDGESLTDEELEQAYRGLSNGFSPPPYPNKNEVLREMQSTGMLQRLPAGDLRSALNEALAQARVYTPFYERAMGTITAPPLSPEFVSFELFSSDDPLRDGRITVTGVDFQRAREDPNLRLRILQGYSAFAETRQSKQASLNMDREILRLLAERGHTPSGNWLMENIDKIVPGARPSVEGNSTESAAD